MFRLTFRCDYSFVCAVSTSNTGAAILRSYENNEMPELLYDECKIWEACRATSAATSFFDAITIGSFDQKFVDGGILYNNPIQLVYREAQSIWPNRVADAVLVSIGTGSAPGKAFEGNIMKIVDAMRSAVTQTERTADDFFSDHGSMVDRDLLFRFNVFHGLADIGLEEYKEKAKMADATHAYLVNAETRKKVKACLAKFSLLQLEST
jgi:predicted acylesterase/phospholipase RssA